MVRIQVDNDENDVRQVIGALAVTNKLLVIDLVKAQICVTLQRWILPSDQIHPGNELLEAVGSIEIPVSDFVFLRIEILFTAHLTRTILTQLKGWPIDP